MLLSTLQFANCEVLNIVTSQNGSCSGVLPCYTLEEFAATNPSHSDNVTLEIQPGTHHLNLSFVLTGSINYVTIRATTIL